MLDTSPWVCAAATGRPARIADAALQDMCAFPALPAAPDASLLEGVIRIPWWADATARPDGVCVTRAILPTAVDVSVSLADAVEGIRTALFDEIAGSVTGAIRVGVLCTGGLDSNVVAAAVTAVTGVPPVLVTAAGRLLSDIEMARVAALAEHLGASTVNVPGPFRFSFESLERLNRRAAWPSGGVFTDVWNHVGAACAEADLDVVFTGEGGNEVFSPAGAEVFDFATKGDRRTAARRFGRWRGTDHVTFRGAIRSARTTAFLPVKSWHTGHPHALAWYGRHAQHLEGAAARWRARIAAWRADGFSMTELQALTRLDGFEAAVVQPVDGVRFEHPLLSQQVRRAFFQAPARVRYPPGGRDKHVLRVVGRTLVPAAFTEGPKIGVANQVAVLFDRNSGIPDTAYRAARWLGFNLDASFRRPHRELATLALDWTQLSAMVAWALNAVTSEPEAGCDA